ncbi:2-amino-4-hydroxy-6-hydroxymethyldihydropteridine diphosphokinase [Paracoccus sp. (in: a-proteobacteria)]|uniref:2-amino-4-hydroxy-6- hydroxymethyldihydropteridine diphosphokinase n=1 Tax=Paracoccus sp. TaxID=267 RepID=UPI003A8998A2
MHKLSFGIIALGANLPSAAGSVCQTLTAVAGIVHAERDISISAMSRFWKTPAFPAGSGPNFINAAMVVRTQLNAETLLNYLHKIERNFGRDRRSGRWSARVLDLDLIAFDNLVCPNEPTHSEWRELLPDQQQTLTPDRLILPHPRMQDRGFVLAPLAEIAPDWCHPVTGRTVAQMLNALPEGAMAGMTPITSCKRQAFA